MPLEHSLLAAAIFVIAALYSSVGHAGASGYIAAMALAGLSPAETKPAALALNVMVATLTSIQFARAGWFSWRLLWPFAVTAVPAAFAGGYVSLPDHWFKAAVGGVLLFAAARLLLRPPPESAPHSPRIPVALGIGAVLGLLAGITGTGGGIFLTPVLLFAHWARAQSAAAASAVFILLNSLSGLAGHVAASGALPQPPWLLAAAALLGGALGSHFGSRRLPHGGIKRLLAVVLIIAGGKLIFVQ